jgi:SAM-dependent methyltransferase
MSWRDLWEARYAAEEYVFGVAPNDFLRERVDELPAGRALCLAEGEGRNAVFLAERGYEVHAVDLAAAGADKTRRLAADRGVTVNTVVADLAEFDLGHDQWHLIVAIFMHLPPNLRADVMRRVASALRPGGVFLMEAYTPDQIGRGTGGPPVAELTVPLADITHELRPLELLHAVELEREVVEGSGHTGAAAVVQIIARRP